MGRPPCCDKANVKKGLWTPEEDAKILAYVSNHGVGNWTQVPKKAGLNRCGKSCRLRWTNYLRPDLKHEEFTEHEEQLIIQYHAAIGSRWSLIAKHLPGRTDNDVKNYWNTKLKKKLAKMGIDPITHKPISKILSDYETIANHHNKSLNTNLADSFSSQCQLFSPSNDHLKTEFNTNVINQLPKINSFNHYMMEEASPASSSSSISNGKSNSHGILVSGEKNNVDDRLFNTDEEKNYHGFLAEELPPHIWEKSCDLMMKSKVKDETFGEKNGDDLKTSSCYDYEHSSVNSFVKALLDRDTEMQLDFPAIHDILHY